MPRSLVGWVSESNPPHPGGLRNALTHPAGSPSGSSIPLACFSTRSASGELGDVDVAVRAAGGGGHPAQRIVLTPGPGRGRTPPPGSGLPGNSPRISLTSLLVIRSASVRKNTTSGLSARAVRRASMWSVPPSGVTVWSGSAPASCSPRWRASAPPALGVGEERGPSGCRRSPTNAASGGRRSGWRAARAWRPRASCGWPCCRSSRSRRRTTGRARGRRRTRCPARRPGRCRRRSRPPIRRPRRRRSRGSAPRRSSAGRARRRWRSWGGGCAEPRQDLLQERVGRGVRARPAGLGVGRGDERHAPQAADLARRPAPLAGRLARAGRLSTGSSSPRSAWGPAVRGIAAVSTVSDASRNSRACTRAELPSDRGSVIGVSPEVEVRATPSSSSGSASGSGRVRCPGPGAGPGAGSSSWASSDRNVNRRPASARRRGWVWSIGVRPPGRGIRAAGRPRARRPGHGQRLGLGLVPFYARSALVCSNDTRPGPARGQPPGP